jgi:hypothetical protein
LGFEEGEMNRWTATVLAVLALGLGACGSDEGDDAAVGEDAAVPEAALADLAVIHAAIADAARQYSEGSEERAAAAVDETVAERFAAVEEELEAADPELAERLDDEIHGQLAEAIESGAPIEEVVHLVRTIGFDVRQAQAVLQGAEVAGEDEGEAEAESEGESEPEGDSGY